MFFRTEHVVKLIGMVTKSSPVLVLMEFMENGDLENFLRNHRQGIINPLMRFTEVHTRSDICQIFYTSTFSQSLNLTQRKCKKRKNI